MSNVRHSPKPSSPNTFHQPNFLIPTLTSPKDRPIFHASNPSSTSLDTAKRVMLMSNQEVFNKFNERENKNMLMYLIHFVAVFTVIWVISLILTFIWRKCVKKEITRRVIIVSTIIAGILRFLYTSVYTIDLIEVILIIVAIPCVLLIRFPKKNEPKN